MDADNIVKEITLQTEKYRKIWQINGGRPLIGKVRVHGSKQSILHLLGALLLAKKSLEIDNFPMIRDSIEILEIYRSLGLSYEVIGKKLYVTDLDHLSYSSQEMHRANRLRSSILLLGSVLLRFKHIKFATPGGDKIGIRNLQRHTLILEDFDIQYRSEEGFFEAWINQRLEGDRIVDINKKGSRITGGNNATALAMILAAGNIGTTIIKNGILNNETFVLGEFLTTVGVHIEGLYTSSMKIESGGLEALKSSHIIFTNPPDKVEIIFWIVASAITKGLIDIDLDGEWDVHNLGPAYKVYNTVLKSMGITLTKNGHHTLRADFRNTKLQPIKLIVNYRSELNGPISDAMPMLIPLLCVTSGVSEIVDEHYKIDRLRFYADLMRMGASIYDVTDKGFKIQGISQLYGAHVEGGDIRAAASLLLAGLGAKGVTYLKGMEHALRGYAYLLDKLHELGADIVIPLNEDKSEKMKTNLLPIVNHRGHHTGKTRFHANRNRLRDGEFIPGVVILFTRIRNGETEILLQRRALEKSFFPDTWESTVTGHRELKESIFHAITREIKEEFNGKFQVIKSRIKRIGHYTNVKILDHRETRRASRTVFTYPISSPEDNLLEDVIHSWVATDEVQHWKWFSFSNLQKLLINDQERIYETREFTDSLHAIFSEKDVLKIIFP